MQSLDARTVADWTRTIADKLIIVCVCLRKVSVGRRANALHWQELLIKGVWRMP